MKITLMFLHDVIDNAYTIREHLFAFMGKNHNKLNEIIFSYSLFVFLLRRFKTVFSHISVHLTGFPG